MITIKGNPYKEYSEQYCNKCDNNDCKSYQEKSTRYNKQDALKECLDFRHIMSIIKGN